MKTDPSNAFYLYLSNGEKAAVMQYHFVLDAPVEMDRLCKAVERTLARMPAFAVQPYLNEKGMLILKENDNEVPVFCGEERYLHLGTEETKGYLFAVFVNGNDLAVCAAHSLSDGRGIFFFAQLLLYYYYKISEINFTDGEKILFSEENPGRGDGMMSLADACQGLTVNPSSDLYNPVDVFSIPEDAIYVGTPYTKDMLLTWKQEELMKVIHELHTTPVCFMAALLGDAMNSLYNTKGQTVAASVPVDMRSILSVDVQGNFTSNVTLPFYAEYAALSMEEKAGRLRADLKHATAVDNLISGIKSFAPILKMITSCSLANPDALTSMFGGENKSRNATRTYLLSNIGAVSFPKELAAHILDFSLRGTNLECEPAYVLLSYGDKGMLIAQQNYENADILYKVKELMDKCGVNVSFSNHGLTRSQMVNPALFERV